MKTRHLFKTLFVGVAMSILLPLAVNAQPIPIDEEHFPDENFRNYLLGLNRGQDGILTEEEINDITFLLISNKKIYSLQGIEYFTALKELSCNSNELTTLDVSCNLALEVLNCRDNQLTNLNLPKNNTLTNIWCRNNRLTTLDVSGCTALTFLECDRNRLTSLSVFNNPVLETIYCESNNLTTLDVSKVSSLTILECHDNQLTSLDISNNLALTRLNCGGNPLKTLDVSKNFALTDLSCSQNQLTDLDVSHNPVLTELYCPYNQLTTLDVSNNSVLTKLYCHRNQIKGKAMDRLISSLPQNMTGEACGFYVYDTSYSMWYDYDGNVCMKSQVADAKKKGWTSYYYISSDGGMWLEYEGCKDYIEPIDDTSATMFSDDMDEDTDLSDTVIDNTYYNMDADNGDGYDASEQAIVLNSTTTDEQMAAIEDANVGDDIISENFNGIIVEVPAGIGVVTVDVKTIGTHVLNVKIGNASPTRIAKSERGTVDVAYNVTEPTYVYIYASTDEDSSASLSRAASVGANSVLLYGYKVTLGATGINLIQQPQSFDVYNLRGNMVRSDMTNLSGLSKGIYVVNGKKVVVK